MSDTWDDIPTTEEKVPRDRWGRPMILPVSGGKPKAYTRATTFAGSVEDMYGLGMWQQRMVALGLSKRADLLLSVSAHAEDKDELNRIVDSAREAAAASAAATTGTALHKLTERYDRGQITLDDVPASNRADLTAYAEATVPLTIHGIEQFVVLDEIEVAGTFDRIVEYGGQRYVADIKTGSIDYGVGKMAVQLALYSRGLLYEPGKRTRGSTGVSQTAGVIIHLPAGQGRCDLYWIDLRAGWEAAQLCDRVRAWRKRKGLLAAAAFAQSEIDQAVAVVAETFDVEVIPDLNSLIASAESTAALEALWSEHREHWTAEHTRAAATRKNQLHQKVLKDAVSAAA
jgi:PD-(D/E)XK nuclease superfamily